MDHITVDLEFNPLVVHQKNFYALRAGGILGKKKGGDTQHTPYGQQIEDFNLHELVADLVKRSDYHARQRAVKVWNENSPVLKKGIALTPVKFGISFTLTHLNQAGALVHIYQDGSIHLNHGGTEMGQGLVQKVAQVAATVFGVGMDLVKITATDTAKVPNTSATAASSGRDLNGMAVKAACETLRGRIAGFLADQQGKDISDVVFEDGMVNVGRGRPFLYFAYGAAVAEVVIDTLTGENRILRTDILHDAGASLNPDLDIGQVEGAYVQGAGWLTMEELVWDDRGRLTTHAPSTYKIPACSDRPDIFNVALWDGENREETIYRSKAVSEPPFVHGVSAFLALSDAISACGNAYPMLDALATPERVLMAVNRMRGVV